MLDPAHPLTPFFSDDPSEVLATLPVIAHSNGPITEIETLARRVGDPALHGVRNGLFAAHIFGSPGSFGHIRTAGLVHPSVFPELPGLLALDTPLLVDVAEARAAIRGSKLVRDPLDFEDDDLVGPRGIAEALRRVAPDHPLLPLCSIVDVPVPPLAARPTVRVALPEAVDDWIGPVNEAWLTLVERAKRELRLLELDVPPIIEKNEAGSVQSAFARVVKLTQRAESHIVPPLVRPALSEEGVLAMAYASERRIVVQRADAVLVIDESGRELARMAPAGCMLRGVVEGRYAVFHEFWTETQPYFVSGDDDGSDSVWPAGFVERGVHSIIGAVSVIDLELDGGSYLERAPASVPRTFVENDQPEELFLGGRELRVGGDRPGVSAYTHDLRFALVAGDTSLVIDAKSGLPVVTPAEPFPDEVADALDLTSCKVVAHEWDDTGGGSASAVGFANGRWWFLSAYGILHDHIGAEALAIVPLPTTAAFDPPAARIAVSQGDTIWIIDRQARSVIATFKLAPPR